MKSHFVIGVAAFVLSAVVFVGAGFCETLPPNETVAGINKAIAEAKALEQQARQMQQDAVEQTVRAYQERYAAAKTDKERQELLRQARNFMQNFLDASGLNELIKQKDKAFQDIIRQVDDAYEIDTDNVRGEPEFSQEVEGEGECYPNGRVRLGPGAFSSAGVVASTKKHEATHANQAAEGRWPSGAVERHDAEIEAYGREITSADTVGLTDAERAEVQRRLHNHLEAKKEAMIGELTAAKPGMDTDAQREELEEIVGKIRDVIDLERKGDEEGAMAKKDHAIEELDELIEGADEDTSEALEGLRDHVEDLKEAELFVLKADTIEDLRDARSSAPDKEATAEINKIIGKLKRLIEAQAAGDEDKAFAIKKDALEEVEVLLKGAKGACKDELEAAKDRINKLIRLEEKITVSGKTEGVGKDPSGTTTILLHVPDCRRYTVSVPQGTTVKAGQTVTVSGSRTEPGKIQASKVSVASQVSPVSERKTVRAGQLWGGPDTPLPSSGAFGSFIITEETRVAVKANGAASSFFINQEKKPEEELDREDGHFAGIIRPGVIALVTGGIIDAVFNQQGQTPPVTEGLDVPSYFDGISNYPVEAHIGSVTGSDMTGYRLLARDNASGQIWDYGSPDLSLTDTLSGRGTAVYSLGELPAGEKELMLIDPQGALLDRAMTTSYSYFVQFRPQQVTMGVPVYGDAFVEGVPASETVRVSLSFDPVLQVQVNTGVVVSGGPGYVAFQATAAALNESSTDFTFDTSGGLGEKQVNYVFSVLSKEREIE